MLTLLIRFVVMTILNKMHITFKECKRCKICRGFKGLYGVRSDGKKE